MDSSIEVVVDARKRVLTDIKEELIERLQLECLVEDIDDDTFLFGSGLSLDSIDAMEVVIGMQARFGVMMPEDDIAVMRTMNTLADYVQNQAAV